MNVIVSECPPPEHHSTTHRWTASLPEQGRAGMKDKVAQVREITCLLRPCPFYLCAPERSVSLLTGGVLIDLFGSLSVTPLSLSLSLSLSRACEI